MNKKENEQEQRLLSHTSLDELIKMKMEEELSVEIKKLKEKPKMETLTDISKVPTELIFSKRAVYKLFNRINKTETYLNGLQAEAMLGLQVSVREKMKLGQVDAFSSENAYIRFEKIDV